MFTAFFKTQVVRLFTARVGVFCVLHVLSTVGIFWIMLGLAFSPVIIAGVIINYLLTPCWLLFIKANLKASQSIADIVYKDKNND